MSDYNLIYLSMYEVLKEEKNNNRNAPGPKVSIMRAEMGIITLLKCIYSIRSRSVINIKQKDYSHKWFCLQEPIISPPSGGTRAASETVVILNIQRFFILKLI